MSYRPTEPLYNPQPMGLAIDAMAARDRDLEHLLGPTGPLTAMPGWTDRPQQRTMAACIRRAWKQGLPAIVEGPTGAGKSVVNIVCAVLHSLETGKPVVISTHTVALQAQYVSQDLPMMLRLLTPWLEAKFGRTFTFAALYGRGRYLCEKKAATSDLNLDEWRETTEDGILDLAPTPQEKRSLTAEKSECPGARCTVAKEGACWFISARQRAFNADLVVVNHALLMASALAQPGTVLPQWGALVVDEAHTLEEIARQARGVTLTAGRVEKLAAQALEFCDGNRQGMLDASFEEAKPETPCQGNNCFSDERVCCDCWECSKQLCEGCSYTCQQCGHACCPECLVDVDDEAGLFGHRMCFETTSDWWLSCEKFTVLVTIEVGLIKPGAPIVRKFEGQPLRNLTGWMRTLGGYQEKRVHPPESDFSCHQESQLGTSDEFAPGDGGLRRTGRVSPTAEGITHELHNLFRSLEHATRRDARDGTALLPPLETTAAAVHLDELTAQLDRLALDVHAAGDMHWDESQEAAQANVLEGSLQDVARELRSLRGGRAGQVSWVQHAREKQPAALHAQPIEVGEFLRDGLWKQAPAALSSATLATTGQDPFAYIKAATGCRTPHAVQVASPFDWDAQARLYLPEEGMHEGLLGIKARSAADREACAREYARVSSMHFCEVLKYTRGRCLALFTSRTQLDLMVAHLRARSFPWPYLTQGEMGLNESLEWMRNTEGGVLLGLASLWEGVSVAGSALSCLWIDRLPINPPTDLLHEARLRAAGGGVAAFREVTLPQVITRMKQGFGRLIRGVTERGLAVLADPRLRTRDYGRDILAALPPARKIDRAGLVHIPIFLAGAGTPVEGDPRALLALDPAGIPEPHRAWVRRLQALVGQQGGRLTGGHWSFVEKLVSKYGENVSERN